MRLRVPNKSSIDRRTEDANSFLLLAENIQRYSSTYGKWVSISKALKLKPKQCKRRWNTLKKHFGLGLLTNRQLIDKLQFLKDVSNEIPVSQFRNDLVSYSRALPSAKENSNLILVPLVDSVGGVEKNTLKGNESEVTEKSEQAMDTKNTKVNVSSNLSLIPLGSLVEDMEETTFKGEESEVTEKSKQAKDNNGTKVNEDHDSDLEIIEPYIEIIEVD